MKNGNHTKDIDTLLAEGFSRKFAEFYLNGCKQEEVSSIYDPQYREWAHSHGFWCEHACLYGLNDGNVHEYLSDYDFYKSWPLNSWQRIWINDKLTLKLMLMGSEFAKVMPKYYYYSTTAGLCPICDNQDKTDGSICGLIQLLREVGELACKPNNGSAASGFYKLSCDGDLVLINDQIVDQRAIENFVKTHSNYIFTEYLHPAEQYARISPLIHTMRVNVLTVPGQGPKLLRSYIRFADQSCKVANYFLFDKIDANAHHIQAEVNLESGTYGNGMIIFPNRKKLIDLHPDSKAKLEGAIEGFSELKSLLVKIAEKFNLISFMGFDVCMATDGFKIMEINSHPGIGNLQAYKSLLADKDFRDFITGKLSLIDSLTLEQKRLRNALQR